MWPLVDGVASQNNFWFSMEVFDSKNNCNKRKTYLMRSMQLFVLVLASGLYAVSADPIPTKNEHGILVRHEFSSKDFKRTDDICMWLYQDWAAKLSTKSLRTVRATKEKRPPVVSQSAVIGSKYWKIEFFCRDNRLDRVIEEAEAMLHEVTSSGPYYLVCDPTMEIAETIRVPLGGTMVTTGWRVAGLCRPRDGKQSVESTSSIRLSAGSSSCLDADVKAQLVSLEAFIMADDDYEDNHNTIENQNVEYMTLQQIGGDESEHNKGQATLTMTVRQKIPHVYRACAKLQPGHGNARLHLVTF